MEDFIAAYFDQLVDDAAHSLAGHYTAAFPRFVCDLALERLTTGRADDDLIMDSVCWVTRIDVAVAYKNLLGQARQRAAEIKARKLYQQQQRAA